MAAASSSSSAAAAALPNPPFGNTGLLRHGRKYGHQMVRGQESFKHAVDDLFTYLGRTARQKVESRRIINLIYPSSDLTPYDLTQRQFGDNPEIITSVQSPGKSDIGQQGVPMRVMYQGDGEYYYAKITSVHNEIGDGYDKINSLTSFREVMINLSLFGSGVQGVAPMYNWFFTSIAPPDETFMKQFTEKWHPIVFSTFYAPGMKIDFDAHYKAEIIKAESNQDTEAEKTLKDAQKTINEALSKSAKDPEAVKYLKEMYEHVFKEKKWYKSANLVSKRALVLISKSAGAINLNRAYGEHGYGFPLERFLGQWEEEKNQKNKLTGTQKRYGIVLFVRPFAALMSHIFGILHEMEKNESVHGDFHYENLIAVPVSAQLNKSVPPATNVWRWTRPYTEEPGKNRTFMNNVGELRFSNLPLYIPVAVKTPGSQLSYPSNVDQTPINGVLPGQYMQFRMIDLGFGYQNVNKMANTFGIKEKEKRRNTLNQMWTADQQISVFPSRFHPWFDKFRLGLYMAKHVLSSIKLATFGVLYETKFYPVIDPSKGNSTRTKLDLIVLMMSSHPANSEMRNGQNMKPKESVSGLYTGVVYKEYLDQDWLTTSRFSIEMIAMVLKLTTLPENWKVHARTLSGANPSGKSTSLFLICHGAINLLRHFLLTVIDLYTKIKVVAKDRKDRDKGVSVVTETNLEAYPQFALLVDNNYITSVSIAFGKINRNFTPALSELIKMDSTFPGDYMSFDKVYDDTDLWGALV